MSNFIHPSDFFSLFAELCLAMLGFQVVATAIGRRVSGNWTIEDKERFHMMVLSGMQGLLFSVIPFFVLTNHEVTFADWNDLYALTFWFYIVFVIFYYNRFNKYIDMPEMDNRIVKVLYVYCLFPLIGYILCYLGMLNEYIDRAYYAIICHTMLASFFGFIRLFKYQ